MFISFKKTDTKNSIWLCKRKISSVEVQGQKVQIRYDGKDVEVHKNQAVDDLITPTDVSDEAEELRDMLEDACDEIAELQAEIQKGAIKDELIILMRDFIDNIENPSKWDEEGHLNRHLMQIIKWKIKEIDQ